MCTIHVIMRFCELWSDLLTENSAIDSTSVNRRMKKKKINKIKKNKKPKTKRDFRTVCHNNTHIRLLVNAANECTATKLYFSFHCSFIRLFTSRLLFFSLRTRYIFSTVLSNCVLDTQWLYRFVSVKLHNTRSDRHASTRRNVCQLKQRRKRLFIGERKKKKIT